jgi:hypothetical protein
VGDSVGNDESGSVGDDHPSAGFIFSSPYPYDGGGGEGGADFINPPPLAPWDLGLGVGVAVAVGTSEAFDARAMR